MILPYWDLSLSAIYNETYGSTTSDMELSLLAGWGESAPYYQNYAQLSPNASANQASWNFGYYGDSNSTSIYSHGPNYGNWWIGDVTDSYGIVTSYTGAGYTNDTFYFSTQSSGYYDIANVSFGFYMGQNDWVCGLSICQDGYIYTC